MPEGRAANQPFSATTLRPPISAPLPGARVSFATIRSPASQTKLNFPRGFEKYFHSQIPAATLVGERGVVAAIAHDIGTGGQCRGNNCRSQLGALGGEQEGLGPWGHVLAMEEDLDLLERRYAGQSQVFAQKAAELEKAKLEDMVENQLVLQEFKSAGYNVPESYFQGRIDDAIRQFGDRLTQVDVRATKIFRMGARRLQFNFDVYNALNANPVINYFSTYSLADGGARWKTPTQILDGRLAKVSLQIDF